jgi:hypothetical protein
LADPSFGVAGGADALEELQNVGDGFADLFGFGKPVSEHVAMAECMS